jgi:phage terminase large subunit GpA-like protein
MLTKKTDTRIYNTLKEIVLDLAEILTPPERLSVSEAATKYRKVNNPGGFIGPWSNDETPYMVEPMDGCISPHHNGLIFVGGAQVGKTDSLIVNGLLHSIIVDPLDILLFCPTNTTARDFSNRRVDRLHRDSTEVGNRLKKSKDADNKFDKHYSSGNILTLSWPAISQLAGRPVPHVFMTDYDRMPDDIDGEGAPYDLASKRTTTFGSFAMCVAESSPSRPIKDPQKWIKKTPHEAPPCDGIIGLYNRGDRRRWYWPCPHCGQYFMGDFSHLRFNEKLHGNLSIGQSVYMECPINGCRIEYSDRREMNIFGRWLADGQRIEKGRVVGEGPRTRILSYWLNGVAASFVSWANLVSLYLDAMTDYERTGSEDSLKKFYNNDLGEPYKPKRNDSVRVPEALKNRAEDLPEHVVPDDVRMLVAAIDVQANQFVVQITGILPGIQFDTVLIDRFDIRKSKRTDEDGERLWVKPHTYLDDWDLIEEQVINKTYPLADNSGRRMKIKLTVCDSGGRHGVTTNAYDYWRKLRRENKHGRFMLVKGEPSDRAPRTRIVYPDSNQRDRMAPARGDVPVMLINSNLLKDTLAGRLDCTEPGKGMFRVPAWVPDEVFRELCAETRTEKGWENPSHTRNEAWDLGYYTIGICLSELIRADQINWENPPGWAATWDKNSLVVSPEKELYSKPAQQFDFTAFGKALA